MGEYVAADLCCRNAPGGALRSPGGVSRSRPPNFLEPVTARAHALSIVAVRSYIPPMGERETRAGTVALVGLPNAGKSSLLNRLLDSKLSIVTPLAQTTRERVVGSTAATACR